MPPRIVDSLSSSDMVQTEGSNVTLECVASGSPEPEVVWRREDAREITIDKNTTGQSGVGEVVISTFMFTNWPLAFTIPIMVICCETATAPG